MSFDSVAPLVNSSRATANGHANANDQVKVALRKWDKSLKDAKANGEFHGDKLLADKQVKWVGLGDDLRRIFTIKNTPAVVKILVDKLRGKDLDIHAGAQLIGSLSNYSKNREAFVENQVKTKYDAMLHPPLTYLGDAFRYRAADGKFNSVLHPHLGMAGTPYARTVASKSAPLGALPDPADVFEKLMARDKDRPSRSGLSSMLIYHATIIIHDIFRTNNSDKNISDTSSYLDLSPLYGYTEEMQREIRDEKFGCGLLKPDAFAEDRLLRQPPGVCIMLVMYNRYHNYAATQLKRINENGRFSIPKKFQETKWLAVAQDEKCVPQDKRTEAYTEAVKAYTAAWIEWEYQGRKQLDTNDKNYENAEKDFRVFLKDIGDTNAIDNFEKAYDAAHKKHDDDLFGTARLITCGMYVNISIHDYLRALMGFHQYNTDFTLEPRLDIHKQNVSRGLGNQVSAEFNSLYRFHPAISHRDEMYTKDLITEEVPSPKSKFNPDNIAMGDFLKLKVATDKPKKPSFLAEFGLNKEKDELGRKKHFSRNTITGLFDDQQMIEELGEVMRDPISNFGPRNVPRCLKNVEILGILQARKWEMASLNDFRQFFNMPRHESFESITKNREVQDALRDLYDHPDKVELYPGIFIESDEDMNVDPGPSGIDSTLWTAIFSDAITLVRSDRFYTVDWNTNSLTSWGMKEVTPDSEILKSSVFHRLLQRAFPEWFPYDSIRFFHPFYTIDKNRQYAVEQGYAATFKMTKTKGSASTYDTTPSDPAKPKKSPSLYLTTYEQIRAALDKPADEIIHPAFVDTANLPPKMTEALKILASTKEPQYRDTLENEAIIRKYFELQTRRLVEREVINMGKSKDSRTGKDVDVFQLDVTRDLAIPVVTRCIADFLGFGHLIKDTFGNPHAPYSENEIYEHITNCQTFLAYNVDETKLLKRRTEFKKSMQFLLQLAQDGNVLEASRYSVSKAFRSMGRRVARIVRRSMTTDEICAIEPMKDLGRRVAERIYGTVPDTGKAAAILLLTALDVAHVAVLAFTATLEHLLQGAYDEAQGKVGDNETECDWFRIQKWALQGDKDADKHIETAINNAQRLSIKLPFIRQIVKEGVNLEPKDPVQKNQVSQPNQPNDPNGPYKEWTPGRMIICDTYEAMRHAGSNDRHLIYASSLTAEYIGFNPKDIALHGLYAMIKVMAQMKDLRRGHTTQGHVKKIQIDQTYEGYANFMAPGRMKMVEFDATRAPIDLELYQAANPTNDRKKDKMLDFLMRRVEDAGKVFEASVLKPKSDTYLSASWDEMIPFPTTWKLRFEGYGPSTYGKDLAKLQPDVVEYDIPPWYQPSGPSNVGGSFAEVAAKAPKVEDTPAGRTGGGLSGCGAPLAILTAAPDALGKTVCEGTEGAGEYAGI